MVRITSGKYRNRILKTPEVGTHPMGAREKLALFNMVTDILPDALVLDAFAGSGALGIEALSRGANEVVFVEKSAKACKMIRENLQSLELTAEVLCENVVNFTTDRRFDLIIADPPYDKFEPLEIEHLGQFMKNGGALVLSHPGEAPDFDGFESRTTRQYAAAHISVYIKE